MPHIIRPELEREVFLLLLGQRLAAVREKAGVTQAQLARALRGGRATQQAISRLESGQGGAPSIITVLEYLLACGTGIGELEELLAAYTAQVSPAAGRLRLAVAAADSDLEPDVLAAAVRYAAGVAAARGQGLPSGRDLRLLGRQAARQGRAAGENAQLRELAALGIKRGSASFLSMVTYGRNVLAALKRTRKSRYWRGRALDRLERWRAEMGLPEEPAARVRAAVERWFERRARG